MKEEEIVVMFCNPHDAAEFLSGEDAEVIENCICMSPVIPEGEVTLVPKDEFLEWLNGKGEKEKNTSELKPCPVCGGEAKLELIEVNEPFTFTDLYYTVICTKCGLSKGGYRIPKLPEFCEAEDTAAKMNAIAEWNRREGE